MGVDVKEPLPRSLYGKERPCRSPPVFGIPSIGNLVGSLAEPEGSMVAELDDIGLVENGHGLPGTASVIPAYTVVIITGNIVRNETELISERFLDSHYRRILFLHHGRNAFAADGPGILRTVVRSSCPHVERNHLQLIVCNFIRLDFAARHIDRFVRILIAFDKIGVVQGLAASCCGQTHEKS